jgi:ribonuclease HII
MFGRVYSAAVILPKDSSFDHGKMKDSKKFHSTKKIKEAAAYIKANAVAWAITYEDEKCIDDINILQATQRSMHASVAQILSKESLSTKDVMVLVDGNYFNPIQGIKHVCVEGGDNKFSSIAAASILAKVSRDQYIEDLCSVHPQLNERYGLLRNKGYGTKEHMDGLKKYGPSPWHRRSFGILKAPPTF